MPDDIVKVVNVPVDVLYLGADPPVIAKGRLTTRRTEENEITLEASHPALAVGHSVVIDGGPGSGIRILGHITRSEGQRLVVSTDRRVREDKRMFPRMVGGLELRYRVATGEPATERAWRQGANRAAVGGTWHEPDPFMNFSGSGVRFQDHLHCTAGDLLLIELRIPGIDQAWPCVGTVVRVRQLPPDERSTPESGPPRTHDVAVHFDHLPAGARDALMEYTLRLQDALV